jgi:hypothetical protein
MGRVLKWKWVAIGCVIILLVALGGISIQSRRHFTIGGPEARLCYSVGSWANAQGWDKLGLRLFLLAERSVSNRINAAVRSGRLALITFQDQHRIGDEFPRRVFAYGQSNQCHVVMVRLKVPTTSPDTYEVLLDPKCEKAMQAFVASLATEKVHSPFE